MKNFLLRLSVIIVLSTAGLFAQQPTLPYVKDVIVEGNHHSSEFVIINNLNLRVGSRFNPAQIATGIRYLYQTNIFSDIQVLIEEEFQDSVAVKVVVDENPRANSVEVQGDIRGGRARAIRDSIPLKEGLFFSDYTIEKSNRIIEGKHIERGYSFVNITNVIEYLDEDSASADVVFVISRGNRVRIGQINFEGNESIEGSRLERVMTSREKRFWRFRNVNFKQDTLTRDFTRIIEYYKNNGFLDAIVESHTVSYDERDRAIINVVLREGQRYYFGDFSFLGNDMYDSAKIAKALGISTGEPFNMSKFQQSLHAVSSLYAERGYLYAQVVPQKVYSDSVVNITYSITEGVPAYVNRVIIRGNSKTRDNVIRREVTLKPGEIYQQSKIFRSQMQIARLGFFNQVIPDVVPFDTNSVDIIFNIEEKETGQISAGVQYSQHGFQGTIGLSIPNLMGRGQHASFNIEYGGRRRYFAIGFTEPWLLNLREKTSLGFNLYREELEYADRRNIAYTKHTTGGSVFSSRRLNWPDDFFEASARYSLEHQRFFDLSEEAVGRGYWDGSMYQSRIRLGLYRNDTDWPDFPTSGSLIGYYPELSGTILGGDKHFFRQTIVADFYFPSFWRFVFETKNKISILHELDGNTYRSNMAAEYFWIGGSSLEGVLRGYPDNVFGPGRIMYTMRANYRFPIVERMFYGGAFVDMGNTWENIYEFNINDLYTGAGFGLRASIPGLGLLGLDFGWGLDKYDSNNNNIIDQADTRGGFNIHFHINQGF